MRCADDEAELFEAMDHSTDRRRGNAEEIEQVVLRDPLAFGGDGDEHVEARWRDA